MNMAFISECFDRRGKGEVPLFKSIKGRKTKWVAIGVITVSTGPWFD